MSITDVVKIPLGSLVAHTNALNSPLQTNACGMKAVLSQP